MSIEKLRARARENGKGPRVHGNGFIQLDVDDRERLHFWGDPRIPRQAVQTPIHDHVFSFRSVCVKGRIIHLPYRMVRDGDGRYLMYEAKPGRGDDSKLHPMEHGYRYCAVPQVPLIRHPGEEYDFRAFRFHESFANEPTITRLYKRGRTLAQNRVGARPRVMVPYDGEPDNEFDRHGHDPDLLWGIIEDMLA